MRGNTALLYSHLTGNSFDIVVGDNDEIRHGCLVR